jgi:hypothetical protein
MVTKGYHEGVYEGVTAGTRIKLPAEKGDFRLKISDCFFANIAYVPFDGLSLEIGPAARGIRMRLCPCHCCQQEEQEYEQ